jgi:energy-coupling factor transport system substrate-specific component
VSLIGISLLFLLIFTGLGFAWFNRTRPSARTVALVAALAGLAALSRTVFAPLPSVKPTTDLILLSGYVLGPAPGCMIGLVAAFIGNFVFGHGPWTLWQMFAWGMIGLFGALLAKVFGKNLGRWTLASGCGSAALIFGAITNFSHWVTFSGDHRLETLPFYYGSAIPFDIAHCIGNMIFCLLFGPALVKALDRYQRRSKVIWEDVQPKVAT